MDKFRKSLRDSFRKKKDSIPESSRPHQWQADENAVRAATCLFSVKYLGCVEVFESRGMQVCEEALKVLRTSRRRAIKGTLYVTGDGLRVVDDETKGLLVDQTIEKVSFCAPDRNYEKGFSYICRDGTTRRWMCHGFIALKDSGERLSHAVGCAFAVCLEKKQKRDKESIVLSFDPSTSTFTRTGSFRQSSLTERMQDPQECKLSDPPPVKPVTNPFAIERPHAPPVMVQRQGSFRGFTTLNQTSPFKRQMSLRLNELPSTLERQKAMTLEHHHSLSNGTTDPIIEASPNEKNDSITAMCQQLARDLTFLTKHDEKTVSSLEGHQSWYECVRSKKDETWLNASVKSAEKDNFSYNGTASNKPSEITNEQFVIHSNSTAAPNGQPVAPPRRSSPNFSHLRSQSLGASDAFTYSSVQAVTTGNTTSDWSQSTHFSQNCNNNEQPRAGYWINNNGFQSVGHQSNTFKDPFDAEWANLTTRNQITTNPFQQHSVKAFEVQM